MCGIKSS